LNCCLFSACALCPVWFRTLLEKLAE
jgi:hypothetical protein